MGGEWRTLRLSEVYEFSSGLSKPRSEFGFGYGFLTFKNVLDNFFVPETLTALVNSTEKERSSCSVRRGDVFLTRTSETQNELGMSCVALKGYEFATFNGFTKRLRPKPGTDIVPEYAGYYFRGPRFRRDITAMSSLSTRASLNNEMLERLSVVLPPITVQVAIGRILKSLDDKIELNRRMNETLEAMARALFRSWFVDFDPVRAKMEGRKPKGMDAAKARLFPDGFEESELGKTPKGWHLEPLSALAEVVMGTSPPGDTYNEHGVGTPLVNGPVEFGDYFPIKKKWTTAPTRLSASGDLIFCVRGSTTGKRIVSDGVYCLGRGVCAIRAKNRWQPFVNKSIDNAIDRLLSRITGSVFPNLNAPEMNGFAVISPPSQVVDLFCHTFTPLQHLVEHNIRQSVTLAAIRNTLLPQLLSGQMLVAQVETILERTF